MIDGISIDSATTSLANAQSSQQLDKDAFTQLLVTQLQNQDPLSPQTNEELAAQLAQFSSLEQMELVNENLVGLARLEQGNALVDQITGASSLVGQEVAYQDPQTGQLIQGPVEYAKVQDGRVYLGIGGVDVPVEQVAEVLGEVGDGDEIIPDEDDDGSDEDSTEE
ncbi:MAG: flagellar hook capping FlgD N-terminal domain-containing protein [Planctomycetota bacterium]